MRTRWAPARCTSGSTGRPGDGPRPGRRAGPARCPETSREAADAGVPPDPARWLERAGAPGGSGPGGRGRPPGARERRRAPAARGAQQDRGCSSQPPQPGRRVRRHAPPGADLLPQAGLGARRPRRRGSQAGQLQVPQLRGRGRDRDRARLPGGAAVGGRGLHRRVHHRERLRAARLPRHRRRVDAAGQGLGHDGPARPGPGHRLGLPRQAAAHLRQRPARAGRLHRRDAVGHALPGRRHRPHHHPLPWRRAAVGNARELPAGPARRPGRGRGGRAGPAGQPHRRRPGRGPGGVRRPAHGERGGHLHRARRGLGVPRHPAADPGLTAGGTPMDLQDWLSRAVAAIADWEAAFSPFARHPSLEVSDERFAGAFAAFAERLRGNYPYFHPSYAGQMLKPPHPAAVAGYLAAMLINPNNHALDGGPATSAMEKEVVAQLAAMFGFRTHLGHLTSSGTVANLEALYVARELHPGRGIAYSAEAHYTHARMCGVLGVPGTAVEVDEAGRIDLGALEELLAGGGIGTVVATAGTTGLGAIDPVHEVLAVARRHGARVHVDAAYGGFFTLLAGQPGGAGLDPAPWRAIAECDSVVVDTHKHGLQPYGSGTGLYKDPEVGRFYLHDSPYTYFTSDELHLGEISLECSRAGASAAALWLTLQLLPLTPDGLGKVLAACRRAALDWAALLGESGLLKLYQPPELDIICYFRQLPGATMSGIDEASVLMLARGMKASRPVFLSTLRVSAAGMSSRHPGVKADQDGARILRSVLMKPEARGYVTELHARVTELA